MAKRWICCWCWRRHLLFGCQHGLKTTPPGQSRRILPRTCKARRKYLLTCKVSRYCVLALHSRISSAVCCCRISVPTNTIHLPNVVVMLAHRLRRWPNITTVVVLVRQLSFSPECIIICLTGLMAQLWPEPAFNGCHDPFLRQLIGRDHGLDQSAV